ncbi:hypothetical protein [Desertibaculum subflavum]|uniref:hypothetical protein n=1 Tax=Desertibaculum subflavum TaxID=2268458 RepID=UPI0013C4F0F5
MHAPGSRPGLSAHTIDRRDLLTGALLFVAAALVLVPLTGLLDRLGAYERLDILFNADSKGALQEMTTGTGLRARSVSHPLYHVLIGYPVKYLVLAVAALLRQPAGEIARHFIYVTPLVAAALTTLLYATLRRFCASRAACLLAAIFFAAGFAMLVFGSILEHFLLSGFLIAAAFAAALHMVARRTFSRLFWIGAAFLCGAITVTNLVPIGILFLLHAIYVGRPAIRDALVISLTSVALLAGAMVATHYLVQDYNLGGPSMPEKYLVADYMDRLVHIPDFLVNAVAPSAVALEPTDHGTGFTLNGVRSAISLPGLALLVMLTLSAHAWLRSRDRTFRFAMAAAALVVAFNLVFHSFWGDEVFLYAPHYIFMQGFLLLAWLHVAGAGLAAAVLVPATALVIAANHASLRYVLGTIGTLL